MAVDRTERLLNVVLCLLGARVPVTRSTLRTAVPGYDGAGSDEAFERMFERDKEELRGMGVPIETVISSVGEVEGYRIDATHYALPELSLTAEEVTVLGLAARAWADVAVAAPAAAAMRKIEAGSGLLPGDSSLIFTGGTPAPGEGELPTLWEAVRTRRAVTFDYLALGDVEPSPRTVEPWATVRWQGAWYLAGWSPERAAARVYRLSRVVGAVRLAGSALEPVGTDDVRELVARLAAPEPVGQARVHLPDGRGEQLRRRAQTSSEGSLLIEYSTPEQLVGEVLTSGGVVLEPESLQVLSRDALERVIERHAGDPDHA